MIVVTSHHEVLKHWAAVNTLPLALVTFDYHTDSAWPFRKEDGAKEDPATYARSELKKYQNGDYLALESRLKNDEHIIAALELGIVDQALIISHVASDSDRSCFEEHRLIYKKVPEEGGLLLVNQVLESSFIEQSLKFAEQISGSAWPPSRFILDIDLDYFRTLESASPADGQKIRQLQQKATLFTVATEPDYVSNLRMNQDVDSKKLLDVLTATLAHNPELDR